MARYSLFGDAIILASKMESSFKANRIICSEASYKILAEQPDITIRKPSKIAIQGKGEMNCYWVGDDFIFRQRNINVNTAVADAAVSSGPMKQAPSSLVETRIGFHDDKVENKKNKGTRDRGVEPQSPDDSGSHDEDIPKLRSIDERLWRRDLQTQLVTMANHAG